MSWQDLIFAAGSVLFVIALLPSIFSTAKPPRSTCALTGLILWAFVPTYASLDLPFSVVTGAAIAACWTVLWVQPR